MSAGKIAAQSFQAAQRLFIAAEADPGITALLERWQAEGTCTRVRVAQTPAVFARACRELPGALMIDEGVTEVEPGSATCFATAPLDEEALPQILSHKRIPVLNAPAVHVSFNPARKAEMDQHHSHAVDGYPVREQRPPTGVEVVGSNPAAGTGPCH